MLADYARRLGISSDRTIKKAQEYERLIQLKGSGFQAKGISQQIICLDLAANAENIGVDKDMLLKLSGLKKPSYNSSKQTIRQILGINDNVTIKDLTVQLGCPEIFAEAETLLEMYKKSLCNNQNEIDHPGFKAAVIMAISKSNKLGVDRIKLQEISGLKKTVFDKLVLSMITIYQQQKELKKTEVKSSKSKRTHSFIETVEAKAKALEEEESRKQGENEDKEVDFAAWKRRMLEEASAADFA